MVTFVCKGMLHGRSTSDTCILLSRTERLLYAQSDLICTLGPFRPRVRGPSRFVSWTNNHLPHDLHMAISKRRSSFNGM